MSNSQAFSDTGLIQRIKATVRDVPDFPKPGILFKDITPVLSDRELFPTVARAMAAPFANADIRYVVGVESRGFILGAPVAVELGAGFIPVRKPGKLPYQTAVAEYALEYGTDRLEIHADACDRGSRVLVVDDVLATGGTAAATCRLVEGLGGVVVGCSFLIVLSFLPGRAALAGRRVESLLIY